MEDLVFKIDKDVELKYFVYTLTEKPKTVYRYNITYNRISEKLVDGKSYRLKLKIPMKKVVIDGFDEINYNKAKLIYKPSFIEKHTLVVEDKSKFDSLHDKAYKELYNKYEMNEQINRLLTN